MKDPKIHFYLFLLLIISVSSIPGEAVPNVIGLTWDKLLHCIEYSILGLLGYRAYHKQNNFNIYLLCIAGVLFGCIDELWQRMIPGRFSSHYDIIEDGIGVICGVSIGHFIYKNRL